MPAPLSIRTCVLVRVTYKGYIECLNEDNHVTVWLIFGRNTDIFPQRDEEARRGDILSIKKDRYRESWVLGVRKIVQQRQRWGHNIYGKGQLGGTRVYQKTSLLYLD